MAEFLITTPRMELIAGTLQTVIAERENRAELGKLLNARIPADWPPDLNDLTMKELSIRWFENHPEGRGWLCWYFILNSKRRELIGIGGFSDVPDNGKVEIGYSILPRFQRQGFATEAV